MKASGLLKDTATGQNRTLYSLRHTYATMALIEGNMDVHTLAKQMGTSVGMLPNAIEQGKTGEGLSLPEEMIACQQGFTGPQVISLIDTILSRSSINASGLHYFIIDEVDNLTKLTQQSLKSALNTTRGVFILTTNNLSQLDKGLLDRCVLVEMNAAQASEYLNVARAVLSKTGVDIADVDLLPTIQAANGSFRNIIHNIGRLARRKA
jgi:hypothetical protein